MRPPQTSIFNFYAVPSLEPRVLPPQPLPGGAAPHWGPELSDITPRALARPHPRPPHQRMPPARPVPRIARATICRFLCLLGRQHSERPILYLFWVLFCTEKEHRSDVPGDRQKTENPGRGCGRWPWRIRPHTASHAGGPASAASGSSKAHSLQGSRGGLQRGQAWSLCLPSQTVLLSGRGPHRCLRKPLRHLRCGPEQTRTGHALWTFCTVLPPQEGCPQARMSCGYNHTWR